MWLFTVTVILDGTGEEQNGGMEEAQICSNHEECAARKERIRTCKGFVAREPVKGHMASSISTSLFPLFLMSCMLTGLIMWWCFRWMSWKGWRCTRTSLRIQSSSSCQSSLMSSVLLVTGENYQVCCWTDFGIRLCVSIVFITIQLLLYLMFWML